MAVPKKKMTNRRRKNRRSQGHGKFELKHIGVDMTSGLPTMPHRMRLDVGVYKGKKVSPKLAS
jgi:ribosomal protein L32